MDKESLYRFFNGTASEAERIQIRNWADASHGEYERIT